MQVFRDVFREKVLSLRGSTSEPCPIGFVLTTGKDISSHVSSRKLVKSEMEPPQENAHGIQFKKKCFPPGARLLLYYQAVTSCESVACTVLQPGLRMAHSDLEATKT